MQFNGKLMNKTWKKKASKLILWPILARSAQFPPPQMDPDLGLLGPNSGRHDFFYKTST